jgi:hypothetical protein
MCRRAVGQGGKLGLGLGQPAGGIGGIGGVAAAFGAGGLGPAGGQ